MFIRDFPATFTKLLPARTHLAQAEEDPPLNPKAHKFCISLRAEILSAQKNNFKSPRARMSTRKFQCDVGAISQAKFESLGNKVNPRNAPRLTGVQVGWNNGEFGIRNSIFPIAFAKFLHDCVHVSRLISNLALAAHKRR